MSFKSKIKDYLLFTKFRLTFSVCISAIAGYLLAVPVLKDQYADSLDITFNEINFQNIALLFLGGLLVTSASIGTNQILERKLDSQMVRTEDRPLPAGRMKLTEAIIATILMLGLGSWLLYGFNLNTMILGLVSYVSYSYIYTPSKRKTPWSVIIGAFPGAMPPMIGAVAATEQGLFTALAGSLFFVQFAWQLPHFWAIAWVSHDDYQKADFYLLPSKTGKSKKSAFRISLSTLLLIPFSLYPWILGYVGVFSVMAATVLGLTFFLFAYQLLLNLDDKSAKALMFASFIYLPLIQFAYVIDRYFFFTG